MTDEEAVLAWIENRREDLIEFVLEFGNVPSPRGQEGAAGRYLRDWLAEQGLDAQRQQVVGARANVVATVPGDRGAGGSDLIVNGHIDTAHGRPDERIDGETPRAYTEAWREGEFLKGDDVANDKGPLAAGIFAALALERTGVAIEGDLHLAGTVGEIAGTTVDEYRDRERYAGTGLGTRRLVESGL
ncbi:MAG: hypothetical protein V5A33_00720, partial [Halobacteriales archaeon]